MNTKNILHSLLIAVVLGSIQSINATPINGLTVALSPDNSTLIASGSNRTFFRMDPTTLEVQERIWNGLSVTKMVFNKDGSVLAATDGGMGGLVTLFDAQTLQKKGEVKNCEIVGFSPASNLFAGIEGNRRETTTLNIYDLSDGSKKMSTSITPKRPVTVVGLSLDGTLAAVLYEGQNDESEAKSPVDTSLKGFDRTIAQQKADGRTSLVEFYEIPSGKQLASHSLFFVSNGEGQGVVHNGSLLVVNYGNQNALIKQDGSIQMFECANSYNYGIAFSSDYSLIMTGGLADLSVTNVSDLTSKKLQVKVKLASWPEYFKGFSAGASGNLYGATDGYRVFKMERNGAILQEQPAF